MKVLKQILIMLEKRGIMTMLGFRKTVGSQELEWPSPQVLLDNFNKPNQVLSVEDMQRLKSISKLSVGARALMKHSHRSSDGFWGNPTGPEHQKNENAKRIA